ncbi:hypothetical protein AgCh_009098 [Apium graveolens]
MEQELEGVGFVDGAFKMDRGPAEVSSPFHAELAAILFLIKEINSSEWRDKKLMFHLDSEEVNRLENMAADDLAKKGADMIYSLMEFPVVRWRMPPHGVIKLYVHEFFLEAGLPNGNRSGIGVVIRNHRGRILRLYMGSLGIEKRRLNELYAIHQGFVRAFLDDYERIELETDNVEAFWEWTDSMINGKVKDVDALTPNKPLKIGYNGKERIMLNIGLNQSEYYKVSSFKTAKEIWDALETYHEGSKVLRKVKLSALMNEFGNFKLEDD